MLERAAGITAAVVLLGGVHAFVPPTFSRASGLRLRNAQPAISTRQIRTVGSRATGGGIQSARMVTQELAEAVQHGVAAGLDPAAIHMAFADQGSNLAGKFFQASLLPYLGFLYFLKNGDKNRVPQLSFFGFQFLLLFVIATIPTGIISKTVYGVSLADVDWLHGAAEALLTVTNLLIVKGFKDAMSTGSPNNEFGGLRAGALAIVAIVAATAATGHTVFDFDAHTPFLAGIGNLDLSTLNLAYEEPANALSIPTWAIHFSSVFEWIFAMRLVWDYAEVSKDPSWKGLTFGMLPLHASGLAACTYHFFYNSQDLSFLVAIQAGLTLLGNVTVAIAALRIAMANGWKFQLPQLPGQSDSTKIEEEPSEIKALAKLTNSENEPLLIGKLVAATFATAYAVKYGQLATGLGFEPNAPVALAMVLVPPVFLANYFISRGKGEPVATTDPQ
mmetsp:Transcript_3089/g.4382  ORF Transcript_3089/g.4382 Transcript_3089/m.4382 type:complete len:446 (-) Transcript_3089:336-1673(-)